LAGPLQQSTHLLECEVGPAGENEEEVLVGVPFHPLDGRDAGLRDRLVGVEALGETVVAGTRPALDEGRCGVAGSFEHFGERVGLIRHVIARRTQSVGCRVEAAEKRRQRRLGLRGLGECPFETHGLGGQRVEGGRCGRGAVASESVGPQPIEGDDDDRVGSGNDGALFGLFTSAGHENHERERSDRDGDHEAFSEA
jgi:hypothetical protein